MSKIKVDDIYSKIGTSPTFIHGAVVPASAPIITPSDFNISGIATGKLIGDGSQITGLSSIGKLIGLTITQIL